MLLFKHLLFQSKDELEFVVYDGDDTPTLLNDMLMVYTEEGAISGQYPISQTFAEISENPTQTTVTFHSCEKHHGDYTLTHSWFLDGRAMDKLKQFLLHIGMRYNLTDSEEYQKGNLDKQLSSGDGFNFRSDGVNLIGESKYTRFQMNLNDAGINVVDQEYNAKVEFWMQNSFGLYKGWFFKHKELNSLVQFFRTLGFQIQPRKITASD